MLKEDCHVVCFRKQLEDEIQLYLTMIAEFYAYLDMLEHVSL